MSNSTDRQLAIGLMESISATTPGGHVPTRISLHQVFTSAAIVLAVALALAVLFAVSR